MFRPMLSPQDDPLKNPDFFSFIPYPCLASPKLDGIRCLTKEGACKSRKYIDLPREQAHRMFAQYPNLDGELIVGEPTDGDLVYNRTQSHVMSSKERPDADLRYYVFDIANEAHVDKPFDLRFRTAESLVAQYADPKLIIVEHRLIENYEQLLEYEEESLELGFEGIMIRSLKGRYKNGRATMREKIIYKLKRFEDLELVIVGFEEQMTNTNEDVRDDLGYAKRSSAKENQVPANTLGKFICLYQGQHVPVSCGSFTHKERKEIWDNREKFVMKYLKVRHFPKGAKDLLRHPRATGFRTKMDM